MTHLLKESLPNLAGGLAMLAMSGAVAFAPVAKADVILYQHTFDGNAATNLGGTAVDVANGVAGGTAGATWTAGSEWKADGSIANGATGGTNSELNTLTASSVLPFSPQAGYAYTLSVTMTRRVDSPNNWLWVGFGNGDIEGQGAHARPNSGSRGLAWVGAPLTQTFLGPSTVDSATHNSPSLASGTAFTIDIVLDALTDPADWQVTWFINNTQVRTETLGGTTIDGESIAQVGFGRYRNAGGAASAFSLTAMPEPTSLMLLGVGAGTVMLRRRVG